MLEHLRVIELGQVIASTFGGMILSDLGAEVIKVEPPAGDADADMHGRTPHRR